MWVVVMIMMMGCVQAVRPAPGTMENAWLEYVSACKERVALHDANLQLCPAFPALSGGGRAEAIGAALGAAQGLGEALLPLIVGAEVAQ